MCSHYVYSTPMNNETGVTEMRIETQGDAARHILAETEKLKALCDTYHKEFGERGFDYMSSSLTDAIHDSSMEYIIEREEEALHENDRPDWMAKHFGMKFSSWSPCITYSFEHNDISCGTKHFYVHADSLHILEPKVGDLLNHHVHGPYIATEKEMPIPELFLAHKGNYIIQRNGIPFMWPEQEA